MIKFVIFCHQSKRHLRLPVSG